MRTNGGNTERADPTVDEVNEANVEPPNVESVLATERMVVEHNTRGRLGP